jgi:acetyl-CoA decarbonylase/synthase complex subunit delta
MPVEILKEKWTGKINELKIGATKEEGGTRISVVKIGGESTLPFLHFEGEMPNKPVVAMEIFDCAPADWPAFLSKFYDGVMNDPAKWAKKCVDDYKAELIYMRLQSAHPDFGDKSPKECADKLKSVLNAVGVPIIVVGCGNAEKDNAVLPVCTQVAKGEQLLFGVALQENYKTLVASCLADGHNIIAQAPIDVNIQKQVNILISEMGLNPERIVMDPTTGALGYGLEYTYSVMERIRLAALSADKTLAQPFICTVGQEVWKAKEAKATAEQQPLWGDEAKRGAMWEITTSMALLMSGADILVMRHPEAVATVKSQIDKLTK